MYQVDFDKPIHVHFMGIGGISMSGLAEILLSEGFTVSGSDMKESGLTKHLEEKGAKVFIGQKKENISDGIDLMVYTAAISPDNEEYKEVLGRGIPTLTRAELLGQIMRNYKLPIAVSGTHGKTTTTSMVSEILLKADDDPTITVGGILKDIGGNLRIGSNEFFVAEACEYTNSFLSFFPKVEIILNIEEDHLDFFKDINDIRSSFRKFASLLPEDGTLIINSQIEDYREITKDLSCKVITYGRDDSADYYATDISYDDMGHGRYTLHKKNPDGSEETAEVALSVVGEHNIFNSLAALAAGDVAGVDRATAIEALKGFHGTDRRFEKKGEIHGVTVIDDYAHHPTEIRATLKAAKNYPHKKLWVVFQPHTYTRTKAFLDDFADALSAADVVLLTDIYAAREKNTIGISSKDLLKKLKDKGQEAYHYSYFDDVENHILLNVSEGDLVMTIGAGDVYKIGEHILGEN